MSIERLNFFLNLLVVSNFKNLLVVSNQKHMRSAQRSW